MLGRDGIIFSSIDFSLIVFSFCLKFFGLGIYVFYLVHVTGSLTMGSSVTCIMLILAIVL